MSLNIYEEDETLIIPKFLDKFIDQLQHYKNHLLHSSSKDNQIEFMKFQLKLFNLSLKDPDIKLEARNIRLKILIALIDYLLYKENNFDNNKNVSFTFSNELNDQSLIYEFNNLNFLNNIK